ncbi:hypothetical protein ABPG72_017736 [Tetrahymena utriculariae]
MVENNKKTSFNASKIILSIFIQLIRFCLIIYFFMCSLIKDPQFDLQKFLRNKESLKPKNGKDYIQQRLISPEIQKCMMKSKKLCQVQTNLQFIQTIRKMLIKTIFLEQNIKICLQYIGFKNVYKKIFHHEHSAIVEFTNFFLQFKKILSSQLYFIQFILIQIKKLPDESA